MTKTMNGTVDLRSDFDAAASLDRGSIYRKANVIQVWWWRDALGRPYVPPTCETWVTPNEAQARTNYEDMRARWQRDG